MVNYNKYTKCGITIHNNDIIKKELIIGIPKSLDETTMKMIDDYAYKNNINIKIFRIYSLKNESKLA